MPSSSFLMNLFKERKKNRDGRIRNTTTDELALVKAAAWAWYQHGSGSEGKQMREFDVTRTCQAPTPSRYKLEAMRKIAQEAVQGSHTPSSIYSADNSLLDAYEIGSISRKLDDLIDSNDDDKFFSSRFLAGDRDQEEKVMLLNNNGTKKKKKKMKGFWLRNAAVCGTREDVVDESRQSQKPTIRRNSLSLDFGTL